MVNEAPPVAFSAALRSEVRTMLRALPRVRRLRDVGFPLWRSAAEPPVLVFQTGMGPGAAATRTNAFLERFPVCTLVNAGLAGSLVPGIQTGEIVVADFVIDAVRPVAGTPGGPEAAPCCEPDESFTHYPAEAAWTARLRQAAGLRPPTAPQAIITVATPLATAAAKRAVRARFGAVAVEMEGSAVAQACAAHGVRFASIRVILDRADDDLPLVPAASGVPLGGFLAALTRPAGVPRILQLATAARVAETALERVFHNLFRSLTTVGGWFDDLP